MLGNYKHINDSGINFVAWTFSKVAGYFDLVQYMGTGIAHSIPHELGSKPGLILIKLLSNPGNWIVYHQSLGADGYMTLNTKDLAASGTVWNNTEPTDTEFSVGSASTTINQNNYTYMAYLFADTPGVIKCGSYIGANTDDGSQVVDCGFKPQFVMIKCTDTGNTGWVMVDSKRGLTVSKTPFLYADAVGQESNAQGKIQAVDQGFAFYGQSPEYNGVMKNYVYMAIAQPFTSVSLTQEEFAQQRLNFETYENRSTVNQGNEALAAREALIAKLREQGYTDAQINAEFGI